MVSPDFLLPAVCDFAHAAQGKWPFWGDSLQNGHLPYVAWEESVRDQKSMGNGNVQAKVRANISGQFEGTAHKNVGFRGKKGQKVHPNFAPNITIFFITMVFSSLKVGNEKSAQIFLA